MMSHTLTAIISKFVTQKHLRVNQTAVISAYFYFYDGVNRCKENTVCVWVWVSVCLGRWWDVSVEDWWNVNVERWCIVCGVLAECARGVLAEFDCGALMECDCGTLEEWHWLGKWKYSGKYITVPFFPPHFQYNAGISPEYHRWPVCYIRQICFLKL